MRHIGRQIRGKALTSEAAFLVTSGDAACASRDLSFKIFVYHTLADTLQKVIPVLKSLRSINGRGWLLAVNAELTDCIDGFICRRTEVDIDIHTSDSTL